MLARLHLSNDLISGMIDLDLWLPVQEKRSKYFFDYRVALYKDLPPCMGWWKNSGNHVYGLLQYSGAGLSIDLSTKTTYSALRIITPMNQKTRLWVGRRVTFTEVLMPGNAPKPNSMVEEFGLKVTRLELM